MNTHTPTHWGLRTHTYKLHTIKPGRSTPKYVHGKKSAAVTGKLILVTAKHLAGNKQVNVKRSLNQLK